MEPQLTPREMCKVWFDKILARYEIDRGDMNVLIDKKTKRLVGQCGLLLQTIEEVDRLEVGYPFFLNSGTKATLRKLP